jgi:hypothetical protein
MEKAIRSTNTGKGRVQLYPSGILHQTYPDGVKLRIEDSTAEMEIYEKEYCNEMKRPILVDIKNIKSVSKESRGIYTSKETARYLSAAALLIGNPVSRIIGNFYMGINKTAMPVKMFSSEKEALAWLKTFVSE